MEKSCVHKKYLLTTCFTKCYCKGTITFKNILWPLSMDTVQMSQGYGVNMRRQFTFN